MCTNRPPQRTDDSISISCLSGGISSRTMTLKLNDRAPSFKLPAKPKAEIDLGQFLGTQPVVLLFFPLAFSSVCTAEMCTMRDDWSQYEKLGAKVFGISVDSPFVTDKFRQLENIPFPILSDFNKDVSRSYGVLLDDLMGLKGVSKRAAFVIGRDGTIKYEWVSDNPGIQVNFDQIKAALAKA
jgi:peroxiredoxin